MPSSRPRPRPLPLLLLPLLLATSSLATSPVFISGYAEGSGNNKALQLYNPTLQTVQLSDYVLGLVQNGGDWFEKTYVFPSGATIASGQTWLLCHQALPGVTCDALDPNFAVWNGDDAVGLFAAADKTTPLDSVGEGNAECGVCGWEVSGVAGATKQHTLQRKPEYCSGTSDWLQSAQTQWNVLPADDFSTLQGHNINPPAPMQPFISQYIEGSSYNKALEIYNPSSAPIHMNEWVIGIIVNGKTDSEWSDASVSLKGFTIGAGKAWVLCHSRFAKPQLCDLIDDTVAKWSGDDAVGLFNGALAISRNLVDAVGESGLAPSGGWQPGTKEHTLVRKASVERGNQNWLPQEWDVYPKDTLDLLGQHTIGPIPPPPPPSPTPTPVPSICGDGIVTPGEACDDGNRQNGDGCSSMCTVEAGYVCIESPSFCRVISTTDCDISSCPTYAPNLYRQCVRDRCFVNRLMNLTYSRARSQLYCYIDNDEDTSEITAVYGGFKYFSPFSNACLGNFSTYPGTDPINAEHSLPQSAFKVPGDRKAKAPLRSDLNHLFAAHKVLNGIRSNYRFAELDEAAGDGALNTSVSIQQWCVQSACSPDAPPAMIQDTYSKVHTAETNTMLRSFEPREAHKGQSARALMYMYTVYEKELKAIAKLINGGDASKYPGAGVLSDFIDPETACRWDEQDPVGAEDRVRDQRVKEAQQVGNPFVEFANTPVYVNGVRTTMCRAAFGLVL